MKLNYQLNEEKNGLIVTGGEDLVEDVIIPSQAEMDAKTYPVTEIGENAFDRWKGRGMKSIVIPESVTKIGAGAFRDCRCLNSIVIPNSVTEIADYTFDGCVWLENIVIPESVTKIGAGAFNRCEHLSRIVIPDSVTEIGRSAFSDCKFLHTIVIPDLVTEIAVATFSGCEALSTILIPDTVTKIGAGAFHGCRWFETFVIPDSVTEIEDATFCDCERLKSIVIPESVTEIGESAFSGCKGLKSIVIPDSVTRIGKHAFWDCTNLTKIDLSDSVTEICESAFWNCTNLTKIVIPDSVTKIGCEAFNGCKSLKSITIPLSCVKIERGAMSWRRCEELEIHYKGTYEQWKLITFDDRDDLLCIEKLFTYTFDEVLDNDSIRESLRESWTDDHGVVFVKDERGVVYSGDMTTLIKAPEGLTAYSIPEGTKVIERDAFKDCWQTLNGLVIPESMVSIDEFAFPPRCRADVYVMTPVNTPEEDRGLMTHLLQVHGAQNPAQEAAMLLNSVEKGNQESNGDAPKREMRKELWLKRDEFSQFPWGEYRMIVKGLDTGLIKRDRIHYSVGRWAEENFVGTTMCGEPWNGVVFYISMEEHYSKISGRYYEGERK